MSKAHYEAEIKNKKENRKGKFLLVFCYQLCSYLETLVILWKWRIGECCIDQVLFNCCHNSRLQIIIL